MTHGRYPTIVLAVLLALRISAGAQEAATQDQPPLDPSKMKPEELQKLLAGNPPLFLKVTVQANHWNEPVEPMKIAGNIYFVGTKGLACWLIKSSDGLILMNTGMPVSGPLILDSVTKLGFKPSDIKLLLTCHSHIDHVGAHAFIKEQTGAQVAILEVEQELLESGGTSDFFYANFREYQFVPVRADRTFKNGESITLGDVSLTAHHCPGHSRGSTTNTMTIEDGGKSYNVVFPDGSGVNPGFRVAVNPSYPTIGDDYRSTFTFLASLSPDIWLHSHTATMNFDAKLARVEKEGVQAWGDPDGYKEFVAGERAKFDATVNLELAAAAKQ